MTQMQKLMNTEFNAKVNQSRNYLKSHEINK